LRTVDLPSSRRVRRTIFKKPTLVSYLTCVSDAALNFDTLKSDRVGDNSDW
jgi:hypothetical protein